MSSAANTVVLLVTLFLVSGSLAQYYYGYNYGYPAYSYNNYYYRPAVYPFLSGARVGFEAARFLAHRG
ncbi:hypothetical protein AAVH_15262 [Aphelenchoides avenae]|nr:hypothetical protein AAVH_15262 [Aphelenchus avenae]